MAYTNKNHQAVSNVQLVSDGKGFSTEIFVGGEKMHGIEKIVIDPIVVNDAVRMHITVTEPTLKIALDNCAEFFGKKQVS